MNELGKAIEYTKTIIEMFKKLQANRAKIGLYDMLPAMDIHKTILRALEEKQQRDNECGYLSKCGWCTNFDKPCGEVELQQDKKDEIINAYAEAARIVALYLKEFCDTSLPYDKMIADAVRKASKELERRQLVSYKDKLPEAHTDVLLLVGKSQYAIGYWISREDHAWYLKGFGQWVDFDGASYWMPLPEQHKEELNRKTDLLDKRICDVEPEATNTETYREFLCKSVEEFGGYLDFDNMTNADVKKYVEHYNYWWEK